MSGNKDMYYLMHENDVAAMVKLDEISGSMVEVSSRVRTELLPPGGNLSRDALKKWWSRRAVPVSQGNIESILRRNGIATVQKYLVQNYGLSLSDHYWLKPVDSEFTWEQINLFENDFRDKIGDLQLYNQAVSEEILDLRGKTDFYPSASLQGELRKKWIVQEGKRWLIKGNYGSNCQQSINEVFATLLHQRQGKVPYTVYQLCELETGGASALGCICENFASVKLEFISAYDVCESVKKGNDQSEYEHFIDVCVGNGLEEDTVRSFLEYQILTDFVITNTDRHFQNFGVLRNTKNLKFEGMAPIFDSGNSLFWNCPNLPKNSDLLDIPVNSFWKKETSMLKYVTDFDCVKVNRLPDCEELEAMLEKGKDMVEGIEGVLLGYQKKVEWLKRLQQGEKIWRYGYGHEKNEIR